jgi:ABC-2 type transport system ATP-binding protein
MPANLIPALAAVGLTRTFGHEHVVDHLNLEVRPGQVHALVGLNGAGKTTLMRLLLGMLLPDAGSVRILGQTIPAPDTTLWRDVGHLIEVPFNYPELTARENVYAAARLHGHSRDAARQATETIIDRLDFRHWAQRRTATLSLGNRQRVGLACALVHQPRLLVLDEPTNSLDPSGVVLVRDLIRELARELNTAALVSSHHLDQMARVAQQISVLHRGRIIGTLQPTGTDLELQFFELVHQTELQLQTTGRTG